MNAPFKPQPPRYARADLDARIPFVQVWQGPFWYSFYVVIDGKHHTLFRKFSFWPDRHTWQRMRGHGHWLDGVLAECYQRGLSAGMQPDDHIPEPAVHRDPGNDDAVDYVHLNPFALKRRGKTCWLLAYGGKEVGELRQRRSGIELEMKGEAA